MLRVLVRVALIPTLLLFSLIAFSVLATSVASAAINNKISFQGKLTNTDGTNVANGTYSIAFSLYTVSSGGSAIWTETQGSVQITDGIFQVNLGSVTSLPGSVDFNSGDIYLGVKVGADPEMSPRILFTASPYSFNSDKLGGIAASGFVQLNPGSQQTGAINISGNATVGGTYNGNVFSSSSLQFSAASTSSIQGASSQSFNIDSGTSGNLSLGATNATAITLGKFGSTTTTAGSLTVNSGTNVPTADQVVIDNTSSTGVTVAGVNGMNIKYKGGAAAVEASGLRIDYTPGSTSGGTWSGLRIVADSTGPVSGVTAYGIKIEGPSSPGLGTEVGLHIASGFDIGVDIASGGIRLAAMSTDPATPATGTLMVYAKTSAGRNLLKVKGPYGVDYSLQPSIFANKISWWSANGNATTASIFNFNNTTNGTATARNVATTNFLTQTKRLSFVSAGTAGSSSGIRHGAAQFWAGNADGMGGYYYVARFGINTAVATTRTFVGMSATTGALTSADPSGKVNQLAFGCDAADTQFTFMHNDNTGASTKDALTGSFPCNTSGVDLYDARIYIPPNSTTVYYSLLRVNTGDYYEGSTATNVPSNTTLVSPQVWINNGTTASLVDISVISQYVETDN